LKYYLLHIETKDKKEIKQFDNLKSAKRYVNDKTWHRCYRHWYKSKLDRCSCKIYSLYVINEKLINKMKLGNSKEIEHV
jgi:hypothetical protein